MMYISNSISLRRYGIYIDSSITKGVIVYNLHDKGPAYKAGIKKGDVIIKAGDYEIVNSARLKYYLSMYKPGDTIDVVVIRDGDEKTFKVTLEESD